MAAAGCCDQRLVEARLETCADKGHPITCTEPGGARALGCTCPRAYVPLFGAPADYASAATTTRSAGVQHPPSAIVKCECSQCDALQTVGRITLCFRTHTRHRARVGSGPFCQESQGTSLQRLQRSGRDEPSTSDMRRVHLHHRWQVRALDQVHYTRLTAVSPSDGRPATNTRTPPVS